MKRYSIIAAVILLIVAMVPCLSSCDNDETENYDTAFIKRAFPGLTWNSTIVDVKKYFKDEDVEEEINENEVKERKLKSVETTLICNLIPILGIEDGNARFRFYTLEYENKVYDYGLLSVEFGYGEPLLDVSREKVNEIFKNEIENGKPVKTLWSNVMSSNSNKSIGYALDDYSIFSKDVIATQREFHKTFDSVYEYNDDEYYKQPLVSFTYNDINVKATDDNPPIKCINILLSAGKYKMLKSVKENF